MRIFRLGALAALAALSYGIVPAGAALASTSTDITMTVNVESAQGSPGAVALVDEFDSTTFGTCQGLTTPGTQTCQIAVPARTPVVLWTQPAAGETWKSWKGACAGSPGPVCALDPASVKAVTVVIGKAHGAIATPESPYTFGNPPTCASNHTLTVDGSGLPADTPASLSDDGTQVATGDTNSSGTVSLTYTSVPSEPGQYRMLTITVGSASASTDVENAPVYCQNGGTGTNQTVSFGVGVADDDANSFFDFTFGKNPTIQVNTNSTGAGSAETPAYRCPTGTTIDERISGSVLAGTPHEYHFSVVFPFKCP